MLLEEVGIFADLPKVELAKLVGEAEEISIEAGETLTVRNAVYLLCSGSLHLVPQEWDDPETSVLHQVRPGEIVGEWALLGEYQNAPIAVARSACTLYRIPIERWKSLVKRHPPLGHLFQDTVLQRLLTTQQTLGRYKRFMNTYTSEIWSAVDQASVEPAAASNFPVEQQVSRPDLRPQAPEMAPALTKEKRRTMLVWMVSVVFAVVGVGIALIPGLRVSNSLIGSLILAWTAINWYMGVLPEYAVALTACLATVLLGVTRPGDTFSGFADPTWFLLLGAFAVGAAVQRSGLLYRLSLHLLRLLPPTYLGQATALALSGTLLTPCLPSVQSRVTMSGLLSRELSEAMRFQPRSKGAAGLAMSAFLGFGQMRFLFLNGSSYSLLAWGLIPPSARQGAGWAEWFWVGLPLGLLVLSITHIITVKWLFPQEGSVVSRTVINRQLSILGKMSKREKVITWVILIMFAGFLLQPFYGVDPSWIALGGFLTLVMFGVLDKEQVIHGIDWQYMLFYGSLAGMVAVVGETHVSEVLARFVSNSFGEVLSNPMVFLLLVGVATMLFRLIFQPAPAILLTAVAFFPLSVSLGFNPLVAAVVAVAASTTWLIPQLLASYTTMHSATQGQCFDHQQVRPLAMVHAAIVLAAVVVSVPYWYMFGFLGGR